jgi:hypothetical protein
MITKEEEKEEEDSNRNIHKKPGRKMGKEKMEEAMNRDVMGTQTIIDKYLSKGTRSAKTLGASMPSKGGSQKPSSIY